MNSKRDLVFQILKKANAKKLKRTQTGFVCLCFYHEEKTPSFNMHENGFYHCWGCKVSGSLSQFLSDQTDMSMVQAKEYLREFRFEFSLEENPLSAFKTASFEDVKKPKQTQLKEAILGIYEYCPTYMLKRNFSKETLKHFEVGFDKKEYAVTIPVRDKKGRLIGISKRMIEEGTQKKYDHTGIHTDLHLYNLHRFSAEFFDVLVVEGQTDVWRIWQESKRFAVSPFGAKLSHTQAELLTDLPVRRIILMFDNNKAGQIATRQAIDLLLPLTEPGQLFVASEYPQNKNEPDHLNHFEITQMLKTSKTHLSSLFDAPIAR